MDNMYLKEEDHWNGNKNILNNQVHKIINNAKGRKVGKSARSEILSARGEKIVMRFVPLGAFMHENETKWRPENIE